MYRRSADMRYVGQGFEITVPIPESLVGDAWQKVTAAFNELYERKFGSFIPDGGIEILNWRADASATIPWPDVLRLAGPADAARAYTTRPVYFAELGGFRDTPVYRDPAAAARARAEGPVLIEQPGSTIVIGPSDSFEVDMSGNVIISLAARR
jgi:N-methylhydantoinase A